ncbi:MAG: hypothetical protein LBR35_00665 [Rickettsiales bacterium]|jgi:hypothetical protein|nr:hypothetical protein [Rickettsiales bacterium]
MEHPYDYEMFCMKLREIAERNCKSKKEWQDQEANDICGKFCDGEMKPLHVEELIERYAGKLYRLQITELKIREKIDACEDKIEMLLDRQFELEDLGKYPKTLRSVNNKLENAKKWRVGLLHRLEFFESKIKFYTEKNMKWLGINEKIEIATIAKEIWLEKQGKSVPKYGYGDTGRGTSPHWHTDDGISYDENPKDEE